VCPYKEMVWRNHDLEIAGVDWVVWYAVVKAVGSASRESEIIFEEYWIVY